MSDGESDEMLITTADLAAMKPSNHEASAVVYELQGPQQAYFELPLDWYLGRNGELEPADSPGAVQLVQRVHYLSFRMIGADAADVQARALKVMESVRMELKLLGEIGYIWWRLYPRYELEQLTSAEIKKGKAARHKVRMRLGTLPTLPTRFWLDLSKAVDNVSSEPLVPRG